MGRMAVEVDEKRDKGICASVGIVPSCLNDVAWVVCNYRGRSEYVRRAAAGRRKWDAVKGRITHALLPATKTTLQAPTLPHQGLQPWKFYNGQLSRYSDSEASLADGGGP
jgi:hypothetical protein